MVRAYGSAFAAYARDELGFKTEMTYILLSSEVTGKWDWGSGTGRVDCQRQRRSAGAAGAEPVVPTADHPRLQRHGDALCGRAATCSTTCRHIGDPARAQLRLYRGGHMYYIDAQSRKAFSADAKAFYQEP